MRTTAAVTVLAMAAGGLLVGACAGDDDAGDAAPASTATTTTPTIEPTRELPDELPAPGTGVVVLGQGEVMAVTISPCTIDASAQPEGEVPAELLSLTAEGETAAGVEANVDVRRFRSLGASPTVTDTITVVEGDPDDPERALVAQRFEVDGLVTDLRDPEADDPLLRIAGSTVDGGGVFAPPGETTGLVEGRLRAVCP